MSTPVSTTRAEREEREVLVVRLTRALLAKGELALARAVHAERSDVRRTRRALACSRREVRFARALLERRTNLWLIRTSQHAFAGDFIVVDLSEPRVEERAALVLELKARTGVKFVSREMHQTRNARAAIAATARATGALVASAPYVVVVGDPDELLEGFLNRPSSPRPRGSRC